MNYLQGFQEVIINIFPGVPKRKALRYLDVALWRAEKVRYEELMNFRN
jgi:hypothetical protein